jgi:hypothetical protein
MVGIKNLYDKGKCLVGLHQGEWRAPSPNSCNFVRVCERCGSENQKVAHTWGDWDFVAEGACDQVRICGRCRNQEQRMSHSWAEPVYTAEGSCERHQACRRCREERPAPPAHVMNGWRYTSEDACTQEEHCSRCQAPGTKQRVEHIWGDWQHSNARNGPVRVCRRCGELQARTEPAPAAQTRAPAAQSDDSRQEMFDALKPKMQQLAESTAALGRILGAVGDTPQAKRALDAESERARSRPAPPTFTEEEIADLLARGEAAQRAQRMPHRDSRLVGHWRHTDAMSSGGFSLVTDYHLELGMGGRFSNWSHSASGMGETRTDPEGGTWETYGETLVLAYDDGNASRRAFELHGDQLFFPQSGSQRLWERVR